MAKKIKESIYSPYTQAVRHLDMMKKVWADNHGKFDNLVFGSQIEKDFFKPIVVLSNPKAYLNINYAPKDIKKCIIRAAQLVGYIQKDIDNLNKTLLYNEKSLKKAAELWLERSVINNTNIANKYLNHLEDKNENLENDLKTFRKEKSQKMNVPAHYIFTDEEMNSLI